MNREPPIFFRRTAIARRYSMAIAIITKKPVKKVIQSIQSFLFMLLKTWVQTTASSTPPLRSCVWLRIIKIPITASVGISASTMGAMKFFLKFFIVAFFQAMIGPAPVRKSRGMKSGIITLLNHGSPRSTAWVSESETPKIEKKPLIEARNPSLSLIFGKMVP